MRHATLFFRLWLACAAAALLCLAACAPAKHELLPVPVPDTSAFERSVQIALQRARAAFDRVNDSHPGDIELANAYGELAMTYHAQDIVASAEPAYLNARTLAPRDERWAYLLGHLYNDSARQEKAIATFEAALALDDNDGPTLFSLGEVYLQHGDFDKAEKLFRKLEANNDARPAALAGLGKVALAKRDYASAVDDFEGALKYWPSAARLRQPLANAYRGLGNRKKAEENLKLYAANGLEPAIPDPIADALAGKVAASRVLLRRGQRYGQAGRFDLAEETFRAAAEANPEDPETLANWGISLANLGRTEEAERHLADAVRLDPANALAHFSLGAIYDREGREPLAIREYEASLAHDGRNEQARVYLADARMRMGDADAAAKLYRTSLEHLASERVRVSLALAYAKARRFRDARAVLEEGLAAEPDNRVIRNGLARILAAAPDASVRDGARALGLAKPLFEATRSPEVGQTYAMALAETGDFDQAVKLQRETMIAYDRMGVPAMKPFLAQNLAAYEARKPAREPWSPDDPIMKPRSPGVQLVKQTP